MVRAHQACDSTTISGSVPDLYVDSVNTQSNQDNQVRAEATVRNDAAVETQSGNITWELYIDGDFEEDSGSFVTVSPGDSQTVSRTWSGLPAQADAEVCAFME